MGSKRNWNIANQAESPDPALASSVKKDTLRPTNFGRIVINDICYVNSYEFSYLITSLIHFITAQYFIVLQICSWLLFRQKAYYFCFLPFIPDMIAPLYLKLTWHLKSWTKVLRHFHICGIFFSIAYVRYIKIVTWLRGFRYKTANFYHSVVSQFLEETWAQRKLNQISKMTRQPWSHVRILINQQGCALRKIDGSPVPWTCKGQKLGSRGHRALLERSPVWTWAFYTCPSLPHPTNNIGRVYPELFPSM